MTDKKKNVIVVIGLSIVAIIVLTVILSLSLKSEEEPTEKLPGQVTEEKLTKASLYVVSSDITIERNGQELKNLGEETTVYEGDTIQTDETGVGYIVFSDGSLLAIDSETEIKLETYKETEEKSIKVKIQQTFGKTWSKVEKLLGKDSDYTVETSNTVASVRGTKFGCETSPGITNCFTDTGELLLKLKNVEESISEILLEEGFSFENNDDKMKLIQTLEEIKQFISVYEPLQTSWYEFIDCLDKAENVEEFKWCGEQFLEAIEKEIEELELPQTGGTYTYPGYTSPWTPIIPIVSNQIHTFGGAYDDIGSDLAIDIYGNKYITGYFTGSNVNFDDTGGKDLHSSNGGTDAFITKYNADGSYAWTQTFGGTSSDGGEAISVDPGGNIYAVGYCVGSFPFDINSSSSVRNCYNTTGMFVVKYLPNGSLSWVETVGIDGHSTNAKAVAIDFSGTYLYVTGYYYNGPIDFDWGPGVDDHLVTNGCSEGFALKAGTNGTYVTTTSFEIANCDDYGQGVTVDNKGNVYITGSFTGTVHDGFVRSYDPYLEVVRWTETFGDLYNDSGLSIITDSTNVYITGYTGRTDNFDVLVASYMTDGTYRWLYSFGGAYDDIGSDIVLNGKGIAITGYFQGQSVQLGGTSGFISNGAKDVFALEYTTSGGYIGTKIFGGAGSDEGLGIGYSSGKTFISGYFASYNVNFDLSGGSLYRNTNGGKDVFLTYF
ncbi:SBBP repeat-containing protein [Candidatus Dojkabacteria bacterium]|nr:SBBP repeat-containing protein [Candidatus Dojkabacteria bacterium]